ncbi:MAG TPA: bifunctional 4-hydroxy-2-oxoglutarate aldolase/2-dehydro-3-deoxy-phosphogluconate aldolase [Fastidiosipila sp.]|nr:bifunctional 4-hydroxy-2-oxoglutarate aldolase/2-dehydro-3-deoxy-phosphogluconate aldolase [Eubacteriales bacterium]MDD3611735.1 bifunctional 4-hydroxy-2-oxoglutarate aldolase/2-dehydro-3-deoxy-phosphogluconate aldolase [Eubacteriales bacterium]HHU03923.1 bifunctional 4-hydroxy-2-oxoglutarate aldolase/2-dehydro-3-deoxy-phosphogluconate aldolase [Fastidiosipila sp.]
MDDKNNVLKQLGLSGLVPVVVLDEVESALPVAAALLKGNVNVMEITLRTDAALESIKRVRQEYPEMICGAGTVTSIAEAEKCLEVGAQFIVSPGFLPELVDWCIEHNLPTVPGCVTPSEIMMAKELGLEVLKFFPAGVYGGLSAMKALAGPFGNIKFIPTGGVSASNLSEFLAAPFVHSVGGSWLCSKKDIQAGNFDKITALCQEAVDIVLGFELAHLGINTPSEEEAVSVADKFQDMFGFTPKNGNSSVFAGPGIEVMKTQYLGDNGHIGIRTANIERALKHLEKFGYQSDATTAKYKDEKLTAIYLEERVAGFAVHLVQK